MVEKKSTKNWKRMLFFILILVFSIFILSNDSFAVNWWDYDWKSRNLLTINSSLIDDDLIDFPIFVKLNSSIINFSNTKSSGEDIRFVSENGSLLYFERIRHDIVSESAEYFVKILNVSSLNDTFFYVYYNNNDSIDIENSSQVWSNNYTGVWHLSEESWNGSLYEMKDSTENNNHGSSYQGLNTTKLGPIYRVGDFDGNNHYGLIDHNSSLNLGAQITINALVNLDSYNSDGFMGIVGKGGWDVNEGYEILIRRTGSAFENTLHWGLSSSRVTTTGVFPLNEWYYITTTVSGTSANIYLNDILNNSGVVSSLSNSNRDISIGRRDTANNLAENFAGKIAELRISSVQRDLEWIKTDYYSITNNLLNYSKTEELGSIYFIDPTPNDGISLDINSTNISIRIKNFIFDSFNFCWANKDYFYYNDNLVLMMNLDNVSALGENQTNVIDVSNYENNGFFQGNALFSSFGRYGGSVYFDGSDDWIQIPDDISLDNTNKFTFEAWLYKDFNDASARGVASKRVGSSSSRAWSIFSFTGQQIFFDVGSDRHSSGVAFPSNRWVHLAITFDGTASSDQRKKFYYDGKLVATTASSQTSISRQSSADLFIGTLNANYGHAWEGYIDEVRVWNRVLDNDEIINSYNSSLNKFSQKDWIFKTQKSNLEDGIYFYNATMANSSLSFFTETRSLIIGSSLFFMPPTPNDNSFLTIDYINVNVTKENLGSNNIGIYLFNSSGLVAQFNSTTSPAFINFTNLNLGEYKFNATVYANNGSIIEKSTTRTVILVEEIGMNISFVAPTPNNGSLIVGNSTLINTNITLDNVTSLKSFNFSWLDSEYSIYDSSLVAHFNLDNNSVIGDTSLIAKDVSLYENDGSISGASWISNGVYDGALNFNGGSNSLSISSFSHFSGESSVTIMGWVKQHSVTSDQYFLWADGNVLIQFGDTFNTPGVSNLRIRWSLNGDWKNSHTVVNTLDANEWIHWAFVFDKGDTVIYKNGKEVYNGSDTQTSISTNSPTYSFGTRTGSGLDGDVDEIRMYKRALNLSEINLNYISNLKKIDLEKWSYKLNLTNLSKGTYNYSVKGINNLNLMSVAGIRNFIVGNNIVNVEPGNGAKFFDTENISLKLNSLEPLLLVQYYINNNISTITNMQTSNDLNWTADLKFNNIGINNITFIYNESATNQFEKNISVLILKNVSNKVTKKILSINENQFLINIDVKNKLNNTQDIVLIDFVENKFNYGSFNVLYDWLNLTSGFYNGTILGWDLTVNSLSSNQINYSITNNDNDYYLLDEFIIGLE